MNERVILLATETKDCFGIAYGFRMFDSLSQGSDFLSEKKFEETPEGDIELLKYAWAKHHNLSFSEISRMFDYIKENHVGIQINLNWYEWDEIKEYLV